ncbi:alpha-mannosidase [Paenibacillus rhizovicinus]|uniref:Alpha-mannosidase n=1 Tax=Paenibacillus rhizovicinus TaxID=2704463 RepID=A0A6C0NYU1_9BACL|nr:glycoside hydrolase family 38 C-terminal domain-containing protein [Paenibacillus rhizovicinus]QHW31388.1 alpha-mannosidase [Paenibacillus rhizovicinus]
MQSKEWLYHIEKWIREKDRYIYRTIAPIPFAYRPADHWVPLEEAQKGAFMPIDAGMRWGETWMYGWFRGSVVIPAEAAGERMEAVLNFGSESTVYVSGRLAGAIDLQHHAITLTRQAAGGETVEIMAEAYAGHDRELPVNGESYLAVVNEELYQFFIDLKALLQLRNGLPPASLRVAEIDKAFVRLLAEMDWDATGSRLTAIAERGRSMLKPLLDCVNGSTAPKLYMMGQSHLDIAWLWPMEETKRKIARTMSNQLALLEEYPEYRYVQSQPYLFRLVKELYPELYGRIKRYVAEGRIIPEGGAWVEPDTNIPSGESLIRQFLYGKRFFREEFGVENEMLWLPDVFGYSGNLPQIMRKSGIRYFASVKMFQTYDNVVDPFPYNTFTWEGIDGSSVPVHLLDYGPFPNPTDVSYALYQWNERLQTESVSTRLVQFGYGDGGGGANRDDLEFLRRMGDLEGVPRTVIASPIEYFEDLQERAMPDARYVGELYYPAHRGTLTSQARMKQGNRKGELALREAEIWGTLGALTDAGGAAYPKAELDEAWRELLLLQFHDILPGTSIKRVHVEAERAFAELLASAGRLRERSVEALASTGPANARGCCLTLFNSLPWEREAVVELPGGGAAADAWLVGGGDGDGAGSSGGVTVQRVQERAYVRVKLPAMGWMPLAQALEQAADASNAAASATAAGVTGDAVSSLRSSAIDGSHGVKAAPHLLENELLRVTFNAFGEITSIYDKETASEWADGLCNEFQLFRDQTSNYDAWEIDRRYAASRLELTEAACISAVAEGALFGALRIERRIGNSFVKQDIRLAAGSRRLEFHARVEWQEKHRLLKVGFRTALRTTEVLNEIQYGYIRRPNHASRPHDADRFEVSQHKWSSLVEGDRCFSLLNDCKYGMNADGGAMNLTLLRAPTYPDERADNGIHEFSYALHVWNGGFMSNPVIREAYELNCPVLSAAGEAAERFSLLDCDKPNIIVDAVKMAEDGSGAWVARLYEAKGASTRAALRLGLDIASAAETDMLEDGVICPVPVEGNAVMLAFKPFEVKTLRFVP